MCVCVCVFVCVLCTSEDWSCKITTECCAVGDLVGTTLAEREREMRDVMGGVCMLLAMQPMTCVCVCSWR